MRNETSRGPLFSEQYKKSFRYLLTWMLVSLCASIIGLTLVQLFIFLMDLLTKSREAMPWSLPLPLYVIFGAAVTGGLIYRIAPESKGEGIPSYITGVTRNQGRLSLKETLFKYWAALFTVGFMGNGGIVGPVGRVSAGIMSKIGGLFTSPENSYRIRRTGAICGLSAVIGSIFHSPIGGGIFAVEILQRANMHYSDIFPAVLSSALSVFFMEVLNLPALYNFKITTEFIHMRAFPLILITAVATSIMSRVFNGTYRQLTRLLKRDQQEHTLLKTTGMTALAVLIVWPIQPKLLGTGRIFVYDLFHNVESINGIFGPAVPLFLVIIVFIIIKILGNCLTVASGLSAGFTSPIALTGLLIGLLVSVIFGIEPYSASYYALLAAGFSGMLAGSMNVPLAAAIISVELFGVEYGFPAILSSVLSFQLNRHNTIYDYTITDTD